MSWAFGLDLKPAGLKFVLVSLADNCGDDGFLWPSLAAICQKTSLDRKTVISAIDELERIGFLRDTGQRVGKTQQVKVYQLIGYDAGTRHYVYRVCDEETGEFYIGVRTCGTEPANDASYMGSGTWPLAALRDQRRLTKTVLAQFKTREEACAFEQLKIREFLLDPLCRNKSTARGTVPVSHTNSAVFPDKQFRKRNTESSSESSLNRKGRRLPPDWELTEARKQWAAKCGKDPVVEMEVFRDYWIAQPGKAGVKLDWDATWRNWCRRSFGKPSAPDSGEWLVVRAAIKDPFQRDTVLPVIREKVGKLGGFAYLGSLKPYDLDQKRKEFEALS